MSIMSGSPKPAKLLWLLKHPNTTSLLLPSFLRHLSVQIDPPTPITTAAATDDAAIVTPIVELLQTRDDCWNEEELRRLLSSSFIPHRLPQIIRRLGNSDKASKFFEWLQRESSVDLPLSSLYQAIFQLASREPNSHIKLSELLRTSRDHGVSLTPNSASLLIRCFGRAHMVTESLRVFNELDPSLRKIQIRNTLLEVLFKSERIDVALQILDEMLQRNSDSPPNDLTGSIVFSALTKNQHGRIVKEEEVIELVSKMGELGVFPDAIRLTQLVTNLCRGGKTGSAWDLLHVVMKKGGSVEVSSCNALLTSLGRGSDFQRMNLLMAEMKEMGIQPNVVTFGILINHLCRSRRVDEALQVFEKMTEEGDKDGVSVQPDVITFNTLVNGLCKVGRQEEGLILVDKMSSYHGCAPNTVTYNCLIDGFCKSSEIERSHELFDRMNKEGVQPNEITLNTLIDGMCKHGRISSAIEFFHDMQGKGLKGNAITYAILICAFCNANNIDKAMYLFEEMLRARCSPDAILYYTLISGLSQAGRLDDAHSIAKKMQEAGLHLDTTSYNVLISGFCRKKRFDMVHELLKEMENEGIRPDEVTYNILITFLSKDGDFSTAHRVMRKMVGEGLVPTVVTHGALIHGYCRAGKLDEAMKIFRDMNPTSRVPPNTVIYNILIDSLCKNKEIETALSLMDDMQVKMVLPNTTTYNAIFKGLQEKNWLEKAFELMDRMNEQACNPDYITMEILTEWLSAVGETAKLRSFVEGYEVCVSNM